MKNGNTTAKIFENNGNKKKRKSENRLKNIIKKIKTFLNKFKRKNSKVVIN